MPDGTQKVVQLVPIASIRVMNPRARNRKVFRTVIDSIAQVGLKRPITVSRNGSVFELVCGQGRLEAYRALAQKEIPAFVIDSDVQTGMLMSLVENLARRQHRSIDLLHDIQGLRHRGYTPDDIAQKTGLTLEYVRYVLHLLDAGETRLLAAVEAGQIPVSVAVKIADASDRTAQRVLQEAYENKLLRGKRFLAAKRLVEQRNRRGKQLRPQPARARQLSVETLLRTYQQDTDKKRLLVKKAEATRDRLIFLTEAFRQLLADENFLTLLRAERFDTLPQNLAVRLGRSGAV
jgi:ParB family transcriptional regulator, chromosome partitioning protein